MATLTNGRGKKVESEILKNYGVSDLHPSPDDRAFTIKSLCFLFSPTQRLKPFRRDRNRRGNRRLGFNGSCVPESKALLVASREDAVPGNGPAL